MKRIVFGTAIVALIVFIFYSRPIEKPTNQHPVNSTKSVANKPSIIQQQLAKKIADIVELENKSLPRMVDNVTRLDSVKANPGAQITYFYTLPQYASTEVSSQWVATEGKLKVAKGVCTDANLQPILASGATLMYVYKGNDGIYINQFQVTQDDCQSIKP